MIHSLRSGQKLVGATATTSLSEEYAANASRFVQVWHITACNTDSADHTITIKIGGLSLYSQRPLAAKETLDWSGVHVLEGGEKIEIQADASGVVDVRISGSEV